MNDPDTLFGGLEGPGPSAPWAPAAVLFETGPVTGQIPVSPPTMPIPVTPASAAPGHLPPLTAGHGPAPGSGPGPGARPAPGAGPGPGADGAQNNGPTPSGTAFLTGAAPAGEGPPSELAPAASTGSRPVNPGFGKVNAPPPGSTVREELPRSQLRPQGPLGQIPKADGFDELLQSVLKPAAPNRSAPVVRPPHPPPQRLMGVSDVLSHARTTSGGPLSAVPRMSPREADFFVMKPSPKKAKAIRTGPRTKLSAFTFVLVLLIVLAAVGVAVFYIHR